MKGLILPGMFLYLATSFLLVSIEPTFMYVNYFFAIVFFIISSPYFFKNNFFNKQFFKLLSFYYMAALFSVLFGFSALYIFEFNKIILLDVELYGRFFNIIIFSSLSLIIVSLCGCEKYVSVRKIALFYCLGCAVLILTGYWQAVSLYLGIGAFPFETRSWVHGFNKSDYDIETRLTGIAAEPSYFVPFVLDFIILSLLVFKQKSFKIISFVFGILVMVLSFSPSGYASTLIAFLLAMIFFIKLNANTIRYLVFFVIMIPFLLLMLAGNIKSLGYVFDRLDNLSEDGRFQSISSFLNVFFDSNIINLLFGYGVTNFKVVSQYTNYSFLMTSNNLFVDVFVEMGAVGLLLMLGLFLVLFFRVHTSKVDSYQKFIAYALYFDLLMTSMIRADYSTSRFFIIVALVFLVSKYNVFKESSDIRLT